MWLIHVNCCPLVSVPQLSLLCWYTRFWAPPLCPEDESPTSIERQIQTPAASQLHTAVTSGPDTAKKKKKKPRLTITRLATPPVLWWNLENINKAVVMYQRQTGSDRFCYEFSLLHIPPWFRGFMQPALQNCGALSAYWCPAHSEKQRPPTIVVTGLSLTWQTEISIS